jgi:hypothetical protein
VTRCQRTALTVVVVHEWTTSVLSNPKRHQSTSPTSKALPIVVSSSAVAVAVVTIPAAATPLTKALARGDPRSAATLRRKVHRRRLRQSPTLTPTHVRQMNLCGAAPSATHHQESLAPMRAEQARTRTHHLSMRAEKAHTPPRPPMRVDKTSGRLHRSMGTRSRRGLLEAR